MKPESKPSPSVPINPVSSIPRFYSVLARVLVLAYAISCFSFITADPDLWGHIKFGGEIWSAKAIPATDPYSYTANGFPWTNHEWLAEVLFYLIYAQWNSTGLLVFKLAVGLLIIHILTCLYRSKEQNKFIYLAYFMTLIPVLAPGFMVRPHLLTYLFLTLLIFILYKFFDGNRWAPAWTPFLTLIWVNCHGGVVAGMGIYAVVVVCELVRDRLTCEKRGRLLAGYFVLSCLVLQANPYGYELLSFFYHSLSLQREISEWNPIILWDTSYLQYKVLALLFLGALWPLRRRRAWEVIIILAAIYFGFKHQRHSILAGIVMTPLLSWRLAQWMRKVSGRSGWEPGQIFSARGPIGKDATPSPAYHSLLSLSLIFFAVFQSYQTFNHYRSNHFKILVDPQVYPVYAVQFMQTNRIHGNILVPFDWGEYVIWHLPKSRVSIDGRFRTVYPEKIIRENQNFSMGLKGWQDILDNTEIIFIRRSDQTQRLLDTLDDWVEVYEDRVSMLFVRKTSSAEGTPGKPRLIYPATRPSYEFP